MVVTFIAMLKLFALWYDERRFASLVGLGMFVGNLGSVLAGENLGGRHDGHLGAGFQGRTGREKTDQGLPRSSGQGARAPRRADPQLLTPKGA